MCTGGGRQTHINTTKLHYKSPSAFTKAIGNKLIIINYKSPTCTVKAPLWSSFLFTLDDDQNHLWLVSYDFSYQPPLLFSCICWKRLVTQALAWSVGLAITVDLLKILALHGPQGKVQGFKRGGGMSGNLHTLKIYWPLLFGGKMLHFDNFY